MKNELLQTYADSCAGVNSLSNLVKDQDGYFDITLGWFGKTNCEGKLVELPELDVLDDYKERFKNHPFLYVSDGNDPSANITNNSLDSLCGVMKDLEYIHNKNDNTIEVKAKLKFIGPRSQVIEKYMKNTANGNMIIGHKLLAKTTKEDLTVRIIVGFSVVALVEGN